MMKTTCVILLAFICACGGSASYELQIVFPDEESKARVRQIEIWALDVENQAACLGLNTGALKAQDFEQLAHLLVHFPPTRSPVLEKVRIGPLLFFVEARTDGVILLRGCTFVDGSAAHRTVVVNLACVCNPQASCAPVAEAPGDGVDNDCDGRTDEECEADADCDDRLDCTRDACLMAEGRCRHHPDNSRCEQDGVFCNGPEVCLEQSGCTSGGNPCRTAGMVCDEENDRCIACTDNADCADDVDCTQEECRPPGVCFYRPDDARCPDDGVFCNGAEFCDPQLGCSHRGDPCAGGGECDEAGRSCLPCPGCKPLFLFWPTSGGGLIQNSSYRLHVFIGPVGPAGLSAGPDYQVNLGPAASAARR